MTNFSFFFCSKYKWATMVNIKSTILSKSKCHSSKKIVPTIHKQLSQTCTQINHTNVVSLSHAQTHTHRHTHKRSLPLSLSRTCTHIHTHTHTHIDWFDTAVKTERTHLIRSYEFVRKQVRKHSLMMMMMGQFQIQ